MPTDRQKRGDERMSKPKTRLSGEKSNHGGDPRMRRDSPALLRRPWGTLALAAVLAAVASVALLHAQAAEDGSAGARPDAPTDAGSPCSDAREEFRRVVSEFQSRQQNTAISVGVRHEGHTVFLEATGLANVEEKVPAEPGMAFSIASITKAFTGVALLKLVESERIELDAEIQRYVPQFPEHPGGEPVTVRMLAHHLGAVRHWGPERNETLYARHFEDVDELLALFRDDPWVPDLLPLTLYSYSSYGYNLLAMAIQRAAGMPFQEYVAQAVLRPLGLASVRFDRPGLGGARRPARYSWYDLADFHELTDAPQRVPDWDYSHNMGGGGLVASVEDLLSFGRAMRAPGLLDAQSLALLWTRPVLDGLESRMSFGWFPRQEPARLGSSGSNAGVQAGMTVWKEEDLVVAVLANSWGRGSRSGELMDDGPEGLIGRLAAVCGVR
jgi:serine beta-lactamase-like protein LACTB, mitochondrial